MNKTSDSKATFKFLDDQLVVQRIRPNPAILLSHLNTLTKGGIERYNLTKIELKSSTFSRASKYLSIHNAELGPIPKRLLFTMVKNTDFIGSMESNPYIFRRYDLSNFALFVNGNQFQNEGLSLGIDYEKTRVIGYMTLFEVSGIHHSNSGLQVTHDMYISGYFMLLFTLTPDRGASEGHLSHPDNGIIRIELKFSKPLPDAITCLLYLFQKDFYFTDSLLMERHSNNVSDRPADIEPQRMEYSPHSNPENSASVRAESRVLSLTGHYVMNRATNHWEGPKYITYSTKDARLRSFAINDWPHG